MIRFTHTITYEEYSKVTLLITRRLILSRRLQIMIAIILFCGLFAPLVVLYNRDPKDTLNLWTYYQPILRFGGVFLLIAVVLVFSIYRGIRRRWQTNAQLRQPRFCEFDEDGMRLQSPSFTGQYSWDLFPTAELTHGLYLLCLNQTAVHFFPETVIPDRAEWEDLLRRKIKTLKGIPAHRS